mmetsp:Transcript_20740/g.50892  ORF Transcript_20740/g.50892 Transcript_20740/m.50892 type:complete len:188 (-) Transcript_20740:240-803(-)|eukprot:CAMPEP_0114509080 /NCGR_PEP_ID=MMETSP0109-20121206/13000_1 /TAXON_ID=29199 /ORGANISM="Chlorarachnion reptans, Strain CCCM449" /LENGTH=187 /DNA_ID=CAMNT_0001688171 /DNA_START=121 /DNA_END=684 /DNA_ORIENTATION=-
MNADEAKEPHPKPKRPNVLVTGTPGTGKTSTCEMAAKMSGFRHINVSELVRQKDLHGGRNDEWDTFILDEDKICDELEDTMVEGGNIVDFHTSDFFPERWFHLVVVLRASTQNIFDRLSNRNYPSKKVTENVQAEIMQVCLDEAKKSYDNKIVVEVESNTVEQLEENVKKICSWISKNDTKKNESKA